MYKLFIALRYLRANKIVYFSIAGVAIGIMAIVTVTSVMEGFSRDFRQRIRGLQAHFVIKPRYQDMYLRDSHGLQKKLREIPRVAGVAPRIEYFGAFGWRSEQRIVSILGIDPPSERETSDFAKFFQQGDKNTFDFRTPEGALPDPPGVVLGRELYPAPGEIVYLQTIRQGDQWNYSRGRFTSLGSFQTGHSEYDMQYVLMDLEEMRRFLKLEPGLINTYAIRARDYEADPQELRAAILEALHAHEPCRNPSFHSGSVCGNYRVQSWEEVRRNLLQAVDVERNIMWFLLGFLILVAAFNTFAIYTMLARAKGRDVGILRSLGATRVGISVIFLTSGLLCGVFGSILGLAGGLTLSFNLNEIVDFIRVTTRELNRIAWHSAPADPSVFSRPLIASLLAIVALAVSWVGLYRPFRRRAWIESSALALLLYLGARWLFAWTGAYEADRGDPSIAGNLATLVGGVAAAILLPWTAIRWLTDGQRHRLAGSIVQITGTFAYLAIAIALVWSAAVSGLLLQFRPGFDFAGWDLFPQNIYYLDKVPSKANPVVIYVTVGGTLFISALSCLYPAIRAALYDPVEAIRNE